MTEILRLLTKIYPYLVRLYPRRFREDFRSEMLFDFSDMAEDASRKGVVSLFFFCARELIHFPISLLRTHLGEGGAFRILRSQPVNTALRGAVGFSIGFAAVAIVAAWIGSWLFSTFDPLVQNLSVWIYDTFQKDNGTILFTRALSVLWLALTGMVFGLLFGLLLGNQGNYYRHMIAGALGWIIPNTVSFILGDSFTWVYFLSENQTRIIGYLVSILIGTFLSASFIVAESDRKEPLKYLVAGVIIYPLGTYLFIKLLFYLWLEITPWFFVSLMFLMIILIGGVIALVMLNNGKVLFVVIVGAAAYLVLSRVVFYIAYPLLEFPAPPYYWTVNGPIFGALFGLLLGLVLGFQKKNTLPQITT